MTNGQYDPYYTAEKIVREYQSLAGQWHEGELSNEELIARDAELRNLKALELLRALVSDPLAGNEGDQSCCLFCGREEVFNHEGDSPETREVWKTQPHYEDCEIAVARKLLGVEVEGD